MKKAILKQTYKKGYYALIEGNEATYYNSKGEMVEAEEFTNAQKRASRMLDRVEINENDLSDLIKRSKCDIKKLQGKKTKLLFANGLDDVAFVEIEILGENPYYSLSHASHIEDALTMFKRFYWNSEIDYYDEFLEFIGLDRELLETGELWRDKYILNFLIDGNDCSLIYDSSDIYSLKLNQKITEQKAKNEMINNVLESLGI